MSLSDVWEFFDLKLNISGVLVWKWLNSKKKQVLGFRNPYKSETFVIDIYFYGITIVQKVR